MNASRLLPLLLALSPLVACSGDSTPTFSNVGAALDQGDQATASGDIALARQAFEYVVANGSDAEQGEALTRLLEIELIKGGNEDAAIAAFERLCEHGVPSDQELVRLANHAVSPARMAKTASAIVDFALARNEGLLGELAQADKGITLLETQGPDADLSGLGYTGD